MTGPELAARITAAKGVLGDFRRAEGDFSGQQPRPDWLAWAQRPAWALRDVLDGQLLDGQAPELEADPFEEHGFGRNQAAERHPAGILPDGDPAWADHGGGLAEYDADNDEDQADNGTEPYCLTCREWVGMFRGLEGWRHFRGDPAPGGQRTLYEADHEPVIGWIVPADRGLSPAGLGVLGQLLADAIARRDLGGDCAECDMSPAGLCDGCAADLDATDAYLGLAAALGIEMER